MYTMSTRKNGRLSATVVSIFTSVGVARYKRDEITIVAQTKATKQAQYSLEAFRGGNTFLQLLTYAMPALVDSVAANVGPSRDSGSILPATMRTSEMMSGM